MCVCVCVCVCMCVCLSLILIQYCTALHCTQHIVRYCIDSNGKECFSYIYLSVSQFSRTLAGRQVAIKSVVHFAATQ